MEKVNFEYYRKDLNQLFKKEEQVLDRITDYCNRTNKTIESSYSISTNDPIIYKLQINVTKE